jgi:hypothetical protein
MPQDADSQGPSADDIRVVRDADQKQPDIYHLLGNTLLLIQIAEERINRVLLIVSADAATVTMEQLEQMDAARRSDAMGGVVRKLKTRVAFPPELKAFLESFIERRNVLAHRFHSIPCLSVATEAGLARAREFLFMLQQDAFKATYVFSVLLHSVLDDRGLTDPLDGIDLKILKFVQETHPEVKSMLPCEVPPELVTDDP